MGDTEEITVAETSDGPGSVGPAGQRVSLPVVELLTGRGFITGKSGSGKSNSASVIAERLLDNDFGLLIVDVDGEYYGLKEAYEILHVGGDEECDIQVTTEHAEKLASLALEGNVPIILDVSSYIDESEAEALLTAVARSLFAKAKKQKQPFLLLVEEVHEYIPEQGSVGECGRMLIKISKRGRKHGLGVCGISQRPADVKKDFITQCDWLLWHRLTWKNDTQVVKRLLDSEYAEAVENLDDGEGFLVTDWGPDVRRVQFDRKETFDAGATPGLDDVERPALKSVSDDLVAELQQISEESAAREDRIAELEAKLDQKEERITQLESELTEARNLQDLAEQFVEALTEADGEEDSREPVPARADAGSPAVSPTDSDPDTDGEPLSAEELLARLRAAPGAPSGGIGQADAPVYREDTAEGRSSAKRTPTSTPDSSQHEPAEAGDGGTVSARPEELAESTDSPDAGPETEATPDEESGDQATADEAADKTVDGEETTAPTQPMPDFGFTPNDTTDDTTEDTTDDTTEDTTVDTTEDTTVDTTKDTTVDTTEDTTVDTTEETTDETTEDTTVDTTEETTDETTEDTTDETTDDSTGGPPEEPADETVAETAPPQQSPGDDGPTQSETTARESADSSPDQPSSSSSPAASATTTSSDTAESPASPESTANQAEDVRVAQETDLPDDIPSVVADLKAEIADLKETEREMLRYYRDEGPASAQNAHFAAGGEGDRTKAYACNRALRTNGFIDHVGRGQYDYNLQSYIESELDEKADQDRIEACVADVESTILESE